jgi:hypothetical protein
MRARLGKAHGVAMASRSIQLRWDGRCRLCGRRLHAGQTASFDDVSRQLTCLACTAADAGSTAEHSRRAERTQVRTLIAEARAALDAARRAS